MVQGDGVVDQHRHFGPGHRRQNPAAEIDMADIQVGEAVGAQTVEHPVQRPGQGAGNGMWPKRRLDPMPHPRATPA